MRLKTVWFRQQDGRSPEEKASVLASTIWRLADRAVTNLSKADYDILTPERGFRIIGEFCAFLVHVGDRLLYRRLDEAQRTALVMGMARRLAVLMEENIRALVGEDGFDYKSNFLGMLERRGADYAAFEFTQGAPERGAGAPLSRIPGSHLRASGAGPAEPSAVAPDFPALRYLGNAVREVMTATDQTWVVDQVMSVEAPQAIDTLTRAVNGLLNPAAPSPCLGPARSGE